MHRVFAKIHEFEIYSYGVFLVLGFLAGIGFAIWRNRNRVVKNDDILDIGFYLIIGGVVGARFVYVLLHLSEYLKHPISMFNVREGGLAWHGGFLGGLVAFIIYSKVKKINLYEFLDLCAAPVILGLAIGRIGCFLNGCCLGMETTSHWGMVFRDAGYVTPRYPTQLYELVLDLAVVVFLLWWEKRKKFTGEIILMMFCSYSVVRFIVEIFRESPPRIAGLSLAQYSSIILFVVTALIVYLLRKKAPDAKKSLSKKG
ncbi:MAG: prolipoprotein diacylglyceryl transferase [Candidatus Eremiobacteraeota bacterium]|nr:prolipoprotein diacylglyceryl transferase [Candidatus Eremiobacteraeota bacterium]